MNKLGKFYRLGTGVAKVYFVNDKTKIVIDAVKVLHASGEFDSQTLYTLFDNMMGYRTNGETWEAMKKLREDGITFE